MKKNPTFFKLKLGVSKLLECRILHQIPQSFWGPSAAPRPPAVEVTRFASRTPLHSFLPTGMYPSAGQVYNRKLTIFILTIIQFHINRWSCTFKPSSIRYRATTTLRRLQIKQYTASNEGGGTKPTGAS